MRNIWLSLRNDNPMTKRSKPDCFWLILAKMADFVVGLPSRYRFRFNTISCAIYYFNWKMTIPWRKNQNLAVFGWFLQKWLIFVVGLPSRYRFRSNTISCVIHYFHWEMTIPWRKNQNLAVFGWFFLQKWLILLVGNALEIEISNQNH